MEHTSSEDPDCSLPQDGADIPVHKSLFKGRCHDDLVCN